MVEPPSRLWKALRNGAGILLILVALRELTGIIGQCRFYFPPDFQSSAFLAGRESFFRGTYRIAFYLHIVCGPFAILIATFLVWSGSRKIRAESDSPFGSVSYSFSIGDVAKNVHNPQSIRGVFAVGKTQTFDEITDGSSMTIALAEIGGSGDRSTGLRFAIDQPEKFLSNPSLTSELVSRSNRYLPDVKLSDKTRGGNWAEGTGGPGLVNTILPPGSPSLLVGGQSKVDGFFSASENHTGGTVVAFVDGSTRFIDINIDVGDQTHPTSSAEELKGVASYYGVWGELGSCNGSETPELKF